MPIKRRRRICKPPAYRRRKDSDQALVTLTDSATGRRRDYWLGEYGTPESRERYHRLIAEWEARGRRLPLPTSVAPENTPESGLTVTEMVHQYWSWARSYYHRTRAGAVKSAIRLLRRFYGHTPAASFGPKKLRWLREQMIRGEDLSRPWSRKYINVQVQRIRRMFKWAACEELVPVTVYQSLCTVEPLRRGETMNVIAPPRTRKSWLVLGLAMAVATGRRWLRASTAALQTRTAPSSPQALARYTARNGPGNNPG